LKRLPPMRALEKTLAELERRLSDPRPADPRSIEPVFADDFIELGSSGRCYTKAQVLAALATEPRRAISIHDFRARQLAPDVALVTYRAVEGTRITRRASIWTRGAGGWKIVFTRGTVLSLGRRRPPA
jgi:hypothetical protein